MRGRNTEDLPPTPVRLRWGSLTALVSYSAVAFLYLGLRLLVEPGRQYVGFDVDPQIFIWAFGWWPHAILHGQNPFYTHAIWAPDGVNLTWATAVPGLALLFSPVTLLAGPVAAYNVAAVLMPALAAWTAFLLCRHLTHSFWASLAGGYVFGFSSYLLGQSEGHPHMSSVFLLPLVALVILRYIEGELDARGLVVRLGPLFALQLLLSTEVSFVLALALGGALVLAFALVPARRRRLASLLRPLAAAASLAALLTAPFLYYAVTGFQSGALHDADTFNADLLNFVIPTKLTLVSGGWTGISKHFPGNDSEQGAYLGLPVLLIVGLFAARRFRSPGSRFLFACLGLAVLASLGAHLIVDGHQTVLLPWRLVSYQPLFDNVLTVRLAVFVSLVAAVMVALWTAARASGVLRRLLPCLAVLALVPNPWAGVWATTYTVPPFFTEATYRTCLDPGENVLPLPISKLGHAMLWQAVDGYRFRMAGGYITPSPPKSFQTSDRWGQVVEGGAVALADADALRSFIDVKQVTSVVVDPGDASNWSAALNSIATPQLVGGVVLYHLRATAPTCPGH